MVDVLAKDGQTVAIPSDAEVELIIDGKPVKFTLDEMAAMASKAGGADAKFRQASQLRAQAGTGLRLQELMNKEDLEYGEFIELAKLTGADDDEAQRRWDSTLTPDPQSRTTPPAPKSGGVDPRLQAENAELKQKLADLESSQGALRKYAEEDSLEKTKSEMKKALDNDPRLGKLVEAQKDILIERVITSAATRCRDTGGAYGPDVLKYAIAETAKYADSLGLLPDKEAETKSLIDRVSTGIDIPNLGPAGKAITDSLEAGKIPDRVAASDPNYEDALTARALAEEAIHAGS